MNREFRGLLDLDLSRVLTAPVFDADVDDVDDLSRLNLDNDLLFKSTGSDLDLGMASPEVKQVLSKLSRRSSSSSVLSLSLKTGFCSSGTGVSGLRSSALA